MMATVIKIKVVVATQNIAEFFIFFYRVTHLGLKYLCMRALFCRLYSNPKEMRILKELDRQVFKDRFSDKQACYEFLVDLKWKDGYNCGRCGSDTYIKESSLRAVGAANAITTNRPRPEPCS